jgi:hypothetical protein
MKERAEYGSIKAWLSHFEVGEQKHILQQFNWVSVRSIASKMKKTYGCRFEIVKNGQMLIVTRRE